MGGLFSFLANSDADTEKRKKELEEALQNYEKQIEENKAKYEASMNARKELVEDIRNARKDIEKQQLSEILYFKTRYNELTNRQAYINNVISLFVGIIMCNHGVGKLYDLSTMTEIKKNYNSIYDILFPTDNDELCKEIFYTMCKISPLLPLVYPTGQNDGDLHNYKLNSELKVDTFDFIGKLDSYIMTYIKGNFKTYLFNVVVSNCFDYMYDPNSDEMAKHDKLVEDLIKDTADLLTTEELINKVYKFLRSFTEGSNNINYIMRLKMLAAKSHKGVCQQEVKVLPKYYPKICTKYELWECILIILNTIFYNYGSMQTSTGELIKSKSTSIPSNASEGGLCYELPEKYIEKCYEEYFDLDPANIWDQNEYIETKSREMEASVITNVDDDEIWMSSVDVHKKAIIIGMDETGEGTLKYENPTHRYTYQLLTDSIIPQEEFSFPKIGATKSADFQKRVLYNIVDKILIYGNEVSTSVIKSTNASLFMSFDYLTVSPPGYTPGYERISTTNAYIYQTILADALVFYLVFPLDITMTMSKINRMIQKALGKNEWWLLPQMIWASSNVNYSMQRTTPSETDLAKLFPPMNCSMMSNNVIDRNMHYDIKDTTSSNVIASDYTNGLKSLWTTISNNKDSNWLFDST